MPRGFVPEVFRDGHNGGGADGSELPTGLTEATLRLLKDQASAEPWKLTEGESSRATFRSLAFATWNAGLA
jgi:hypothetical protein